MRIQVHDFAGHPFQAELSRQLAENGHTVEHLFSPQYASGKGQLSRVDGDAESLGFVPVTVQRPFEKYGAVRRIQFEAAYAKKWQEETLRFQPDCVVACNVPLFVLSIFRRHADRSKQPWVLWHQDLFSRAISDEIDRRVPKPFSHVAKNLVQGLESKAVSQASQVVPITHGFREEYEGWGIRTEHVTVIPNWAPLKEILPRERSNKWGDGNWRNDAGLRLLYAGTLGRKHNPMLLIELLKSALDAGLPVELVVASEGEGAELLRSVSAQEPLLPIRILPFQEMQVLPDMLGSADILIALLEPSASKFSVPSKVLTSFASGRPVLGFIPPGNPAAADIEGVGGCVVPPLSESIPEAVLWLAALSGNRQQIELLGRAARLEAEQRFGIVEICSRFETVLERAVKLPVRSLGGTRGRGA